ncbi:MAG: DsbA family protein [bacterium]
MEENKKLVTTLLATTLLLTLVNAAVTYSLYSKFSAITANVQANNGNTQAQGNEVAPSDDSTQPTEPQNIEVGDSPAEGSASAPVTIVEFSDFQCPYCAMFTSQTLPQIDSSYIKTGKVKFVFKNFPLPFHENAQKASEAAMCANEQGKFWQYHEKLFANQSALAANNLKQYAKDLGLDTAKFNTCLDSGKMVAAVKKDADDATKYGVDRTPSFFINGVKVVGALPFSSFQQAIDQALANTQ